MLGKEISFIKRKNNNKLAVVFFLTQNMASSQYIQERIKIHKEDRGKKKKKREDAKAFSLPFQWKLQSIPEASWQILSLLPIIQRKIIIIGPDDPLSSLPTLPILVFCDLSTNENAFNDLTTFFSFYFRIPKTNHPTNSWSFNSELLFALGIPLLFTKLWTLQRQI